MNVIPWKEKAMTCLLCARSSEDQGGNGVVLFPEGTRSKDGNLQPARAGIGLVISKTLAPVLPMRIFGAYQAFQSIPAPSGSRKSPWSSANLFTLHTTKLRPRVAKPINASAIA
jgi:1-acyl-sn-glycerol-3-phosphate acyltransferase